MDNYYEAMIMDNHTKLMTLEGSVVRLQEKLAEMTVSAQKNIDLMAKTQKALSRMYEEAGILKVEIKHMQTDITEKRIYCSKKFSVIGRKLDEHGEVVSEIEVGKKAAKLAWGLVASLLLALSSGALYFAGQALHDIRDIQVASHDLKSEQAVINTRISHLEGQR